MTKKFLNAFLVGMAFLLVPVSASADGGVLNTPGDSMSYAAGIGLGTMARSLDEGNVVHSETDIADFLKGLEEKLPYGLSLQRSQNKSYAIGGIMGIFMGDGLEHNPNAFSLPDLIEGIHDGGMQNYERMDTTECMAIMERYSKIKDGGQAEDSVLFRKASYAYGVLKMSPKNVLACMNEGAYAGFVPKEEQNVADFAQGYEDVLVNLTEPKSAYEYGQRMGRMILFYYSVGQDVELSPNWIVRGAADILKNQPLLIKHEVFDKIFNEHDEEVVTEEP